MVDEKVSQKKTSKKTIIKKTIAKKKQGSTRGYNFFNEEADVADDSDEEEDYEEGFVEEILDKDEIAAREAVDRRHELNRNFLEKNAEELALEYEERQKNEARLKRSYRNDNNFDYMMSNRNNNGSINHLALAQQQSILPSILDPKIFKLKIKLGNEILLVRSILKKSIDIKMKGGILKIKSVFCSNCKGFIYIEALSEAFAKEIIQGIRLIYGSSFSQVPIGEMTAVLTTTVQKKPLVIGQWVRLKRGPLKGDLAVVKALSEGGSKAFIQAVPRPDYTLPNTNQEGSKKTSGGILGSMKVRPQQRLFDAEELRAVTGIITTRTTHDADPEESNFDLWGNDYYKDGFLFKEVNASTYLEQNDVKPRIEELQLFRQRKTNRLNNDDDEDTNANEPSYLKDLAEQISIIGEEEEKDGFNPFLPGDMVQVISGDLRNLVARVLSINDVNKVATILPYNNPFITKEMNVELNLIVKHIVPGAHVKVVNGRDMGQTGRVVSVLNKDGGAIAVILTDGINKEIECNVGNIQMSSEVTTGYGNLQGYELYDLVALNDHDYAVVIHVGSEKLKVIDNQGNCSDLLPSELKGKRNTLSAKATSFDQQQNCISNGDTVKITTGSFASQSGTVKHMMKGFLWLHSNSHLKNSGVFVEKSRNCIVAGARSNIPAMSSSYRGVLQSQTKTIGQSSNSLIASTGKGSSFGKSNVRDSAIGQTVRIRSGAYKGLLAQVVDATTTHYSLELLAKLKKIVLEKDKTISVGGKNGSFESNPSQTDVMDVIPNTPFLTQATPLHNGSQTPRYYVGAGTPMHYGNETPSGMGNSTPFSNIDAAYFTINAADRAGPIIPSANSSLENYPGSILSGSYNRDKRMGWESSSASSFQISSNGTDNSAYNNHAMSEGTYTPMTINSMTNEVASVRTESTMLTNMSINSMQSVITFRDWKIDMVVIIKNGPETGKLAVIQQKVDDQGMFHVCCRDGSGKLGKLLHLHYGDIELAPPTKKCNVLVLAGAYIGKNGVVQSVKGRDAIVKFEHEMEGKIMQLHKIAWINSVK